MKGPALLLLLLTTSLANAQEVRKYANEYLKIGAGARGMGLANAASALTNDVSASWYNPASLSQMEGSFGLHFSHAEYFSGVLAYDFGGIAFRLNEQSHFGLSFVRMGVDNIPNTFDLIGPDGQIDYGAVTAFSAADYAVYANYARQKIFEDESKSLSYGGNLKVLHRKAGPFATAWGVGLDAGVLYRSGDWRWSIAAKDITTTLTAWSFTWTEEQKRVLTQTGNAIPTKSSELALPTLTMASAKNWKVGKSSTLAAELGLTIEPAQQTNRLISSKGLSATPQLGIEFGLKEIVYFRAGVGDFGFYTPIESDKRTVSLKPAVGAGLHLGGRLALDYALTDFANSNASLLSHVVGLSYSISQPAADKAIP